MSIVYFRIDFDLEEISDKVIIVITKRWIVWTFFLIKFYSNIHKIFFHIFYVHLNTWYSVYAYTYMCVHIHTCSLLLLALPAYFSEWWRLDCCPFSATLGSPRADEKHLAKVSEPVDFCCVLFAPNCLHIACCVKQSMWTWNLLSACAVDKRSILYKNSLLSRKQMPPFPRLPHFLLHSRSAMSQSRGLFASP